MSKLISFSAILLLLVSCNSREKVNCPKTEKIFVTDTYFDTEVEDPYRWLEDDMSAEVKGWVQAQNEVTFSYLEQIPQREELKRKIYSYGIMRKLELLLMRGITPIFIKMMGCKISMFCTEKKERNKRKYLLIPINFQKMELFL